MGHHRRGHVLRHEEHAQFGGKSRTKRNVVGSPLWPNFTAKTTGFLFMISGVLALLGGVAQINPIWQFGSYQPSNVTYAVQPDWYLGWLDGALRIMPSWEWTGWGHILPLEVFIPAVVLPAIVFTVCLLWPYLEARFTKDLAPHHLLDRPRDRPRRTAFGAGFFALVTMLFLASSTDVLANFFQIPLTDVLWAFRVLVIVVPVVVSLVTWRVCWEMQGAQVVGTRKRSIVVTRSDIGQYSAAFADLRPGDERAELDPIAVGDSTRR